MLHAPLALIAGLFAGSFLWLAPQGGLDAGPTGIAAEAAQGGIAPQPIRQMAMFD
ncbi:hypothetical protein N0B44_05710 [Roseibacterium beibuensis]|uniref:hypothetical protein n=1 Tax=[Roseibacterium] beibuensis TaxID=1193142 RepID=UPI00217DDA64|nr:hypothetical protein [Roseibacterium beibuensis]MCS6622402.1 hypothetical protein [Roseibacterium beibuensis]